MPFMMEEEKAPDSILALVNRFDRNKAEYRGQGYNELQLRQEFINQFFEALGWDMTNKSGAAPQYRDVIHEDSIKMAGGTKAPDYCFTLAGRRMFFVETKKPAVDVIKDPKPAYQLRRYGWSAGLPVSILTNFEYFIVYDSRQKPKESDKVTTGKIQTYAYHEYAERWAEIADNFSKNAVLQGSFDRFKEATKLKRGTQEVGSEFLKEIETWRDALAKNIALRNPHLTVLELNQAVQGTIDRIIFLRMCEDRGVERYGQLQGLIGQEGTYKGLGKIFIKADEKYNSGLFHFKTEKGRSPPDELALKLMIDDKVLESIIKSIYYPDSPYEFSVLRPEILGYVYEQFLGKVIRLTEGHHAKVEEKTEVKKAGGVFYTPQYIVEYIAENTVGKLCKGKTPKQIEKLHILDPACGSGSFLLGAYTYLLDHHLKYYSGQKNPGKFCDQIYQGSDGQWFLTIKEKKRILLNNIFGVDIDSQAVEVTKLSLLLKVLEGAGRDVFEQQQKLWTERALPDLGNNIKCGNSLIGIDFHNTNPSGENTIVVNAFDWDIEFKNIMSNGGFDVVLGNPPYRMLQPHNTTEEVLKYLRQKYFAADFKVDFFHLFLQQGILLLKEGGFEGFIIPVTLLNNVYVESLREWLDQHCRVDSISVASDKVFSADVFTTVLVLQRDEDRKKKSKNQIKVTVNLNESFIKRAKQDYSMVSQKDLMTLPRHVWNVLINDENSAFINKLRSNKIIGKTVRINRGLITGDREKYFARTQVNSSYIPIIAGSDVFRYFTNPPSEYVLFDRPKTSGGCWNKQMHQAPHKIVIRQIGRSPMASLLQLPIAVTGNIFTIQGSDLEEEKFLLGIINSKLISYYWGIMFADFKTSFPQVTIFNLEQIPIPKIYLTKKEDKVRYNEFIGLVDKMLDLHQHLNLESSQENKISIRRQIESINKRINDFVYSFFSLSKNEVELIERIVPGNLNY